MLILRYYAENEAGSSSYSWNITTTKSLAVSQIFFFRLSIGKTNTDVKSHYFNITGDVLNSTSSTPTSSPITKTTTSTTHTTTPMTMTSLSGSGLSTGFFFRRKRESKRHDETQRAQSLPEIQEYCKQGNTQSQKDSRATNEPHELDTRPCR